MTNEFKTVDEALAAAYAALNAAEELATEAGESFYFSPAYGMGGSFDPEEVSDNDDHWFPSSLSCY